MATTFFGDFDIIENELSPADAIDKIVSVDLIFKPSKL